jgi:zinc/manganese transport system substrate-binding protein
MCLASASFAAPLPVVTSFSILADMVENIGGHHVAVHSLIKARDPHNFEPSAHDIQSLQKAKLIVINGLDFEPWLNRLLKAATSKPKVVVASAHVVPLTLNGQHLDPHAWQDLANGQLYVQAITEGLIAVDAPHQDDYQRASQVYLQQLQQLDVWVRQQLASIPTAQRKVISSHQAFAYFAKAYDLAFYAPQGINDQARPSAAAVAQLIEQMRTQKIKLLFVEHNSDPRLLRACANETGGIIGGQLYAGSLTAKGGEADSYVQMFRHNVMTLKTGLTAK